MNRSAIKRIGIEQRILRHMRMSRNLSMREAGALFGLSSSTISHLEHGRMDLPPDRIPDIVSGYRYSMEDFESFRSGEQDLPIQLRDECIQIIEHLDQKKLEGVYGLLKSFLPEGVTR